MPLPLPSALSVDAPPTPSLGTLFLAFTGVAVSGFGGVMPFARRMLVEERRWMTPEAFNEVYALAQFLPGGNILNVAVVVGGRLHGALGAIIAVAGLLAVPMFIFIGLGLLYSRFGEIGPVDDALSGIAAAAAGLVIAMAAKMAGPLLRARAALPVAMAVLAFSGVALAGFPLVPVLLVLAPVSIALAWARLR